MCPWAMESFLETPSRVLSVPIEPNPQEAVPQDVVDRSEAIEGTTRHPVHHWMEPVAIDRRHRDLQESVVVHRSDQLVSGPEWHFARGEDDTHRVATIGRRECGEEPIGFKCKLLITRPEKATRTAWTVEVRSRNLMGELRVHAKGRVFGGCLHMTSVSRHLSHGIR